MKLFIFGSTGDLVKRKVLPALHEFKNLEVYALGRKELDHKKYGEEYCATCTLEFKSNLKYHQISFEDNLHQQLDKVLDKKEINYFYISMHPEFILGILTKLSEIKKQGYKIQILIEKPFGSNLEEAKMLKIIINNEKLSEETYLADHYLFKKYILELNKTQFNHMKLVSLEKVALEGRGYYDSVGALRDMVQSHFLNIIFKILKFKLSDIKVIDFKSAQYKDYQKELGKKSETPTYVKVTLKIKDREIILETGKNFEKKESYIEIDGKKQDLEAGNNPYVALFDAFFKQEKFKFPTMDNSIFAWEVIHKIEESRKKLEFY